MQWNLKNITVLRGVYNRDIGTSPHELVNGRKLRGPRDELYSGKWMKHCKGVSIIMGG